MNTSHTFLKSGFAAVLVATLGAWFPNAGSADDLTEVFSVTADRSGILSVAVSRDGKKIVSGGWENVVKIWDAGSGKQLTIIDHKGKGDLILDVAFSPDGGLIATSSRDYDNRSRTVALWNAITGAEAMVLRRPVPDICHDVAFSPDGSRVAAGCFDSKNADRTVQLWDTRSGAAVLTIQGINGPIAFSPDGKRVTGGHGYDRFLKVSDAGTGQEVLTLRGHDFEGAAYSPDGSRIVTANEKGILILWDAGNGRELITFKGHTDRVNDVAFSPDGSRIASAGEDKSVRLWDARSGAQLAVLTGADSAQAVAFSPDGNRLVGGIGGTLKLLSIATSGPPVQKSAQVAGSWIGPNGENFELQQNGNQVTVREGSKILAKLPIAGNTITWGGSKGMVKGNTISWDNDTAWTRKTAGQTTTVGPPVKKPKTTAVTPTVQPRGGRTHTFSNAGLSVTIPADWVVSGDLTAKSPDGLVAIDFGTVDSSYYTLAAAARSAQQIYNELSNRGVTVSAAGDWEEETLDNGLYAIVTDTTGYSNGQELEISMLAVHAGNGKALLLLGMSHSGGDEKHEDAILKILQSIRK